MSTGAKEAAIKTSFLKGAIVLQHALHSGTRVKSHSLRMGFDRRRLGDFAVILAEILIPGLLGVLFFAWLTSSATHWRGDLATGCVSLGRGGNPCLAHPAQNDRADRGAGAEADCASFGKGGRLCFAPQGPQPASN